ncbi:MAG TPA: ferritin family protein [Tepidisphaeraceae bacterium]|jgi:rubrerythrin|nr:ferritin family protein [Tepidisphaeraceae bacterium]
MRSFDSLTEQEILALAISSEEEDSRIYGDFAQSLQEHYPTTADMFRKMQAEEIEHRKGLYDQYRKKYGEHLPLIRRQDVRGFVRRKPVWLYKPLSLQTMRRTAESMEVETRRFYLKAAERSTDASVRELLTELAEAERGHVSMAERLQDNISPQAKEEEDRAQRRLFLLQVVQPGLAGLMDGSVSTLAPLFAAAFADLAAAKHFGTMPNHWIPFKIGLAASAGAGISMGFAEALSDDGTLTGRGHPWVRGLVCGLMTTLGGIGHTLPYLISNVTRATEVAIVVVILELGAISWIRHRYMDTPWFSATLQVVVGGILVFLTGMLIGSS